MDPKEDDTIETDESGDGETAADENGDDAEAGAEADAEAGVKAAGGGAAGGAQDHRAAFAAFLSEMDSGLDGIPEEPDEQILKGLKAESLKRLSSDARGVLKQVAAGARREVSAMEQEVANKTAALQAKEAAITQREQELAQRQQDLLKIFTPARLKELLGPTGDSKKLDPYSEEGMRQNQERAALAAVSKVLQPLSDEAAHLERENNYRRMVQANPEMGEESFRQKVKAEIDSRGQKAMEAARRNNPKLTEEQLLAARQAAIAGTLQDAINAVKLREQTERQDAERARQRAKRQDANKHIARTTQAGARAGADLEGEIAKLRKMEGADQFAYLSARPDLKRALAARATGSDSRR